MSDILLLCNPENDLQLEQKAAGLAYRLKTTDSVKIARDWIAVRDFDFFIIDFSFGKRICSELANALWERKRTASCIVYSISDDAVERPYLTLNGFTVCAGNDPQRQILAILGNAAKERDTVRDSRFRVLLVEDLDSPREIIAIYLESLGYAAVDGSNSGENALKLLQEEPGKYSCVITDLRMPGMQGEELVRAIRRDKQLSHLPVIALTANGTMERVRDSLKAGISGFLVKPPRKKELERELAKAERIILGKMSPRLVAVEDLQLLDMLFGEYL